MRAEADAAADLVPSLAEHRDAIAAAFDRAGDDAGGLNLQRIHGDLHLGQVLRTLDGWKIIDFEGEPTKSLTYRRSMHSPLKDIAGMLRSFDYAARGQTVSPHTDAQHRYRAAEWAARNRTAFCDGYAAAAGIDPRRADSLLRAFELDKAIYEVVYEHGHRPSWEPIPLQAVVALTTPGGTT
jgi:maltokinase